jgi:hypothetical protein
MPHPAAHFTEWLHSQLAPHRPCCNAAYNRTRASRLGVQAPATPAWTAVTPLRCILHCTVQGSCADQQPAQCHEHFCRGANGQYMPARPVEPGLDAAVYTVPCAVDRQAACGSRQSVTLPAYMVKDDKPAAVGLCKLDTERTFIGHLCSACHRW